MMTVRHRLSVLCLSASAALTISGATADESCTPIQFERGHDAATITGKAPADGQLCYRLATGAGQQATVTIDGQNMMFSIVDVVDAQDHYRFTTEKKTYRILVSQLLRAVTEEAFTLKVSVR